MASIFATKHVNQLRPYIVRSMKFNVLEFARRSVAALHSLIPIYFVLPALRSSSSAGIESSSGVFGSMRCR
jgi:hypothetical protein